LKGVGLGRSLFQSIAILTESCLWATSQKLLITNILYGYF
jgi:hypothetical protein